MNILTNVNKNKNIKYVNVKKIKNENVKKILNDMNNIKGEKSLINFIELLNINLIDTNFINSFIINIKKDEIKRLGEIAIMINQYQCINNIPSDYVFEKLLIYIMKCGTIVQASTLMIALSHLHIQYMRLDLINKSEYIIMLINIWYNTINTNPYIELFKNNNIIKNHIIEIIYNYVIGLTNSEEPQVINLKLKAYFIILINFDALFDYININYYNDVFLYIHLILKTKPCKLCKNSKYICSHNKTINEIIFKKINKMLVWYRRNHREKLIILYKQYITQNIISLQLPTLSTSLHNDLFNLLDNCILTKNQLTITSWQQLMNDILYMVIDNTLQNPTLDGIIFHVELIKTLCILSENDSDNCNYHSWKEYIDTFIINKYYYKSYSYRISSLNNNAQYQPVLNYTQDLTINNHFTDFEIIIGDTHLYVNSMYMATKSEYFKTMIEGEFNEHENKKLIIDNLSSEKFTTSFIQLMNIIHGIKQPLLNLIDVIEISKICNLYMIDIDFNYYYKQYSRKEIYRVLNILLSEQNNILSINSLLIHQLLYYCIINGKIID